MWTLYIILDIAITMKRIRRLRKHASTGREQTVKSLYWNLIRDCLYLPNAVHWTIGGVLPGTRVLHGRFSHIFLNSLEPIVPLLGVIEAIMSVASSYR